MNEASLHRPTPARGAVAGALVMAGALAAAPVLVPATATAAPESFAALIDRAAPAVVQITAKNRAAGERDQAQAPLLPEQMPDGPMREFLERFLREGVPGPMPGPSPHGGPMALGSGFIISEDGTIVTNDHVVGGATEIEVKLKDGRTYPARLVGSDDKTDLAVLDIDAEGPLVTVGWGNSDSTRVGDWVVAVGNPFGLSGTVTAGIVSSRGRDLGAGPYDDFLQIDAPLNTGNSGGPLFDASGKVVGVNTAIFSPTGGNVGIGFAIPSNIAEKVVAELREKGTVERGWLGVAIQPVTPEVAESLGLETAEGALIATVNPESPAAKAGLRPGDVVLGFDGRPIAAPRDLSRAVAETDIDSTRTLQVWRDNQTLRVDVRIGDLAKQTAALDRGDREAAPGAGDLVVSDALGLTLSPLDATARSRFGLAEQSRGAVVAAVGDKSRAAEKGLRPGDLIIRVNQTVVGGPGDVVTAVEQAQRANRRAVLLLVERAGEQRFVAVDLA